MLNFSGIYFILPRGFLLFDFCFLFETESLCSFSWPAAHHRDKGGLELTNVCLLLPPKCWDQKCMPLCPAYHRLFKSQRHLDELAYSSLFRLKSDFFFFKKNNMKFAFEVLKQLFFSVCEQLPICQVTNGLVLFKTPLKFQITKVIHIHR